MSIVNGKVRVYEARCDGDVRERADLQPHDEAARDRGPRGADERHEGLLGQVLLRRGLRTVLRWWRWTDGAFPVYDIIALDRLGLLYTLML